MSTLGFGTELKGSSIDAACDKVTAALAQEGWGVLTSIDVKATFKAKLGVDVAGYRILGACHPTLAHRALEADKDVGLLMPCNVIVYETGEGAMVRAVHPEALLPLAEHDETRAVMKEAETSLQKAFAALSR